MVEGEAHLSDPAAVLAVAIPVLVFVVALFALYTYMVRTFDPFHLGLLVGTVLFIVAGVLLAGAGVALSVCLVMVTLAPLVVVVGYETIGHRHAASSLRRVLS